MRIHPLYPKPIIYTIDILIQDSLQDYQSNSITFNLFYQLRTNRVQSACHSKILLTSLPKITLQSLLRSSYLVLQFPNPNNSNLIKKTSCRQTCSSRVLQLQLLAHLLKTNESSKEEYPLSKHIFQTLLTEIKYYRDDFEILFVFILKKNMFSQNIAILF